MPTNFPLVKANEACSRCHGTGYKYQKKKADWRVCEFCAREYGTDLRQFDNTTLIPNMSLYTIPLSSESSVPPPSLPRIKADPACNLCHGNGYLFNQATNYWLPCDRCIKKFGNMMICKKCVGTGYTLRDGEACNCFKKHIKPAKV